MSRILLPILLLGTAAGCSTAHNAQTPQWTPTYWIDGTSPGVALSKAAERCPDGYSVIGRAQALSTNDYAMSIQCARP